MIETNPLSGIIGAGQLDKRVRLEKLTIERVGGEPKKNWSTSETVQAYFKESSMEEKVDSGATTAYGRAEIVIRWFPEIYLSSPNFETWRVAIDDAIPVYAKTGDDVDIDSEGLPLLTESSTVTTLYEIKHIEELGRRRFLRLQVERWR